MSSSRPNPSEPNSEANSMAIAMEWVSRIITVAAEMVLPGLAGQWVDRRWGTSFCTLLGFAMGLTLAIWHLIRMTSPQQKRSD